MMKKFTIVFDGRDFFVLANVFQVDGPTALFYAGAELVAAFTGWLAVVEHTAT